MLEIRLHGRGGQGAVTSAELIAIAAINKGNFAQAFPSFGPERRGAPVVAFCRVDDRKINIRAKVYKPDVVIVLDPGLLSLLDPTEGMGEGGILILNTRKKPEEITQVSGRNIKVVTVDANKIATEELGRPIVNTTMLGGFVRATGLLGIEDIKEPLLERFGKKLGERNLKAMERAYHEVSIGE
ncbi:MAG: Pyruvate synthase subunit PorC [Deltaproteobacteria bacterium ADurb.BinA179]|jgi:pyruvate ferredoxin oxidoreductase gamma subunit|nr:pyruvate ferredoxin oxidoreductase subunit gamma [Deltaproteobacteria bacterium]MDI9542136.1 pyruvate ferredoxin oxidoreductase subunit gamma [Pseudomonadota bacterium]NLW69385.1 pyruvate ferredoxin oxidoreductase subunit gamma [Bacteriovoracaceae bacterium]OPZ29926.1 MAG: Pyruvate synthase subunit PorC [Deltaproteobacteria bacterium ADurb.BinA179]HRR21388.1 pyruvate ferredoxin oxidoreductase subunit gamma [Desulfomonilia bacterium]